MSITAAQADALLTDVRIFVVENGYITPCRSVLTEGSDILAIGPAFRAAGDFPHIGGADGYLILGPWDSHGHIFPSPTEPDTALPLYLINGMTGIRGTGAL